MTARSYREVARELIEEVRSFGAEVLVIDGEVVIHEERHELSDGLRRRLAEHRLELLAFVRDAMLARVHREEGDDDA